MKTITEFINESAKKNKFFSKLVDNFLGGIYDAEDDEQIKRGEDLISSFCSNAKSLTFESSTADYWDVRFCKQNDNVENEVEDLPDNADWVEEDICSFRIDGNVLYMSSQSGSPYNGDYFDLKCTKKV